MRRERNLLTVLCTLGLVCATPAVLAEPVVEELIVTAMRHSSTVQEVPFSLNVQTSRDIQRQATDGIEDLSRNIAGFSVQNLGPGQSQVSLRGVSAGQIVRDQPGVKEQVGVYLDDSVISLSLFTPDFDLYDLQRVETLRGPQGTLFGAGSIGGTVRFITNQPKLGEQEASYEFNGNALADGGTGGHAKLMYNQPLGLKTAARLVAYYNQYGGFIDALGENDSKKSDVNSGSKRGARLALRFEPNDRVAITPRVVVQHTIVNGFNRQEVFNLYANPYTTPAIEFKPREQYLLLDEKFEDDTTLADLTIAIDNGAVLVDLVSSWMQRDILVSRDASALTGSVTLDIGDPLAAVALPSNLVDRTDLEQLTQEIRISSLEDANVQWVFGIFVSSTDRKYSQRLPTPGFDNATDAARNAGATNGYGGDSPFNSDLPYDIRQQALFGEVLWPAGDRVTLSLGVRANRFQEERSITAGGLFAEPSTAVKDQTDSQSYTPRALLQVAVNQNINLNFQVSEGFRLGGVNDPLNATICTAADREIFGGFQSYDDERLRNYEVGVKGAYDKSSFSSSFYVSRIDDLQVTLDAGSCSSRVSFNVPKAHSTGLEFEADVMPTDSLEIGMSASFVNAEFDSTVLDGAGSVLGGIQEGNRLASIPEFQLSAYATWSLSVGPGKEIFLTMGVQHVGDRITQPGDQLAGAGEFTSGLNYRGAVGDEVTSLDLILDAYTLVNFGVGVSQLNDWDLMFYIKNAADENVNLSFDRERGGRARLGFHTNQPRTIGLTWRQYM